MMEQVFDFREFMRMLLQKSKLVVLLAVIGGLLGGVLGICINDPVTYRTTASLNVTMTESTKDGKTPLTDAMSNIKTIVTDDYFFTDLLTAIQDSLSPEKTVQFLDGNTAPTLADWKDLISVSVKGNLVLVAVQNEDPDLAETAASVGIRYTAERLPLLNPAITVNLLEAQTINVTEMEGTDVYDQVLRFGLLGLAGGIAVGVLWIFFFNVFDLNVRRADDLRSYPLPVLSDAPSGEDDFCKLAIALAAQADRQNGRLTVVLTSSLPFGNRTNIANGLLPSFAALNCSAASVDLTAGTIGAVTASNDSAPTKVPAGELTTESLCKLLDSCKEYDLLLLTAPALQEGTAAMLLAATTGNAILVEQKKHSRTDRIDDALRTLDTLHTSVLGFVLVD